MSKLNSPLLAHYTEVLGNIVDYMGINIFEGMEYTLYTPPEFEPEAYKAAFERKFIDHFYFWEIGQETIQKFIFYFQERWKTLITIYNKVFEAWDITHVEDIFTNDVFTSDFKNIYNDAPKGVVDFDNNHATNYTTGNNNNKGLRGQTKADAIDRYISVMIEPNTLFFDNFQSLFFGLQGGN